MLFVNKSMISGKWANMEFDMSQDDFEKQYMKWKNGMLIQHAFPNLSIAEREFIKTGITPEEWTAVFGDKA
jgi:hypothetical protein